jgi:hypothetical protein
LVVQHFTTPLSEHGGQASALHVPTLVVTQSSASVLHTWLAVQTFSTV